MKQRRSRSVSIVRLLREQQDFFEERLKRATAEMTALHDYHLLLMARLDAMDHAWSKKVAVAIDELDLLASFTKNFWLYDDATSPLSDTPQFKSAEILAKVPPQKKHAFALWLERLMSFIQSHRHH